MTDETKGTLGKILAVVGAGVLLHMLLDGSNNGNVKEIQKEPERTDYLCYFDETVTAQDFYNIVVWESKRFKRITIKQIVGHIIYCAVISLSGESTWDFTLDFNDYGKVTGNYWIFTDNDNSGLPNTFGKRISEIIISRRNAKRDIWYCWNCGAKQRIKNANYCYLCGKKMSKDVYPSKMS